MYARDASKGRHRRRGTGQLAVSSSTRLTIMCENQRKLAVLKDRWGQQPEARGPRAARAKTAPVAGRRPTSHGAGTRR